MSLNKTDIKIIQSLKTSHGRKKHQLFLVEGPKMVDELLQTKLNVNYILSTQDWYDSHLKIKEDVSVLKQSELDKLSLFSKANQVIAVVEYPKNKDFVPDTNKYILVLDTIQDPGNLGTIIRTAEWFGIQQIICSLETADIFNPKVVQASMGSVFRVNTHYLDLSEIISTYNHIPVYGTLLEGQDIKDIPFSDKGFILIGNESKGISDELKNLITQSVFISPASNSKTESLNAAVACGILLSHLPNE